MIYRWSAAVAFLAVIGAPSGTSAFVSGPPSSPISIVARPPPPSLSRSTSLYMGPPVDPSAPVTERYGEGSRKYRRTVYTHKEWVKHRSSDRFVRNIQTLFNSGIYKQVANEVTLTSSVAVFVCAWNLLVGGYQDFAGVMHDPVIRESWAMMIGLPLTPFTLLTPSLGLLLGEFFLASEKKCLQRVWVIG